MVSFQRPQELPFQDGTILSLQFPDSFWIDCKQIPGETEVEILAKVSAHGCSDSGSFYNLKVIQLDQPSNQFWREAQKWLPVMADEKVGERRRSRDPRRTPIERNPDQTE